MWVYELESSYLGVKCDQVSLTVVLYKRREQVIAKSARRPKNWSLTFFVVFMVR